MRNSNRQMISTKQMTLVAVILLQACRKRSEKLTLASQSLSLEVNMGLKARRRRKFLDCLLITTILMESIRWLSRASSLILIWRLCMKRLELIKLLTPLPSMLKIWASTQNTLNFQVIRTVLRKKLFKEVLFKLWVSLKLLYPLIIH